MPDPHTPTELEPATNHDLVPNPPAGPTRTERAVWWLGGHFGELVAVAVSTGLTVWVSAWFAVLLGAVVLVWVAHEWRPRRGGDAS